MLINIQLLRFLAALMVVFHHAAVHLASAGHVPAWLFQFGKVAGFAGVDVFFVISGFIMFWTTDNEAGGRDALRFFGRRIARIYSGYWPFFLLALGLFLVIGGPYLARAHLLESALLLPTGLEHLLIPVSWTLIFEMGFYLLFAILIAMGGRRKAAWIWGGFGAALAWFLWAHFGRHAYDVGRLEHMNVYEQYLLFPYLLEFLAGALLAHHLKKRPEGAARDLLLPGLAALVFAGWVNEAYFSTTLIQGYHIMWRVLVFGLPALLIVAGLVRLELQGWAAPRKFSLLAGGSSYTLYLSHTLILVGARWLGLDAWTSSLSSWMAHLAYTALVVVIVIYSLAHYQCVERPLHRGFRRLLRV